MNKPKIGLICFVYDSMDPRVFLIQTGYVRGIIDAGGIPIIIPVTEDLELCRTYMNMIDGLLVPGGEDMAPEFFGEDPVPQVDYINRMKDVFELEMIKIAREKNIPIFGICRGLQVLNVAFGGTLYQDIPSQTSSKICHLQSMDLRSTPTHLVKMEKGSVIADILGEEIMTNSYHHQGIKELGEGFKAVGHTNDGIIEAIETADGRIFAVQWHPEHLYKGNPAFMGLFKRLIDLSSK